MNPHRSDQTVIGCLSHNFYYNDDKARRRALVFFRSPASHPFPHKQPFPHRLMWQLEAKPGSWPAASLPPVHHAKVNTHLCLLGGGSFHHLAHSTSPLSP